MSEFFNSGSAKLLRIRSPSGQKPAPSDLVTGIRFRVQGARVRVQDLVLRLLCLGFESYG